MKAPDTYMSACVQVIYQAAVYARGEANSGKIDARHIADLMDAIHNIPEHVENWERCNVELLRNAFLGSYQEKWASRGGPALLDIFDQVLKQT